jgi:hypothetical protein
VSPVGASFAAQAPQGANITVRLVPADVVLHATRVYAGYADESCKAAGTEKADDL